MYGHARKTNLCSAISFHMSTKQTHSGTIDHAPEKRYFILTMGRSGSSLLSRILTDAGADFAGKSAVDWTPLAGAFESNKTDKTAFLFSQAHHFYNNFRHALLYKCWHKKIATYKRNSARRRLRAQLAQSHFFKQTENLHFAVRPAADLGYWPTIILNYRDFRGWLGSLYPGSKYDTIESLTTRYCSILRNSLALLDLFGGCVVSYDELMDPNETRWAEALGAVTQISPDALLESRKERHKSSGTKTSLTAVSNEAQALEAMAQARQGVAIPPSEAALKRWT